MQRVVVIRSVTDGTRDRWVGGWRWAASQPGWVTRIAVLTFLLVVAVPVALLLGLAMLVAVAVFAALALASAAARRIRGLFGPGDGRSNVRVRDQG